MNIKYTLKTVVLVVSAATIALVTACSESYPENTYIEPEVALENQEELSDRTPVMLFVNPQNFFTITAESRRTRSAGTGAGPFVKEDIDQYFNSIFYVFAFRKITNQQGATLTSPTDFTQTAYAEINKKPGLVNDSIDHADCLLDGKDYLTGLTTQLHPEGTGELKIVDINGTVKDTLVLDNPERKFFYSTKYEDVPYNFYGYYFDNFKYTPSNTHRDADKIWYSDVTIDGTQDILWGMAPDLTYDLLQRDYKEIYDKYDEELAKIADGHKGYCTITAHRGIHPTIPLEHQLARLQIVIEPGDSSASDVIIDSIVFREKYKADFVVAGRNKDDLGLLFHSGTPADTANIKFQFEDEDKLDILKYSDGTPCLEDGKLIRGYQTKEYNDNLEQQDTLQIGRKEFGKSIMLPAGGKQYEMHLYWHQRVRVQKKNVTPIEFSESVISRHSKYSVKAPKDKNNNQTYQKGYFYTVIIKVYGIQDIQILTSITGWENGGDIPIDPDDDENYR